MGSRTRGDRLGGPADAYRRDHAGSPGRLRIGTGARMRKLRISPATLRAFKQARIRELTRRGKPIPENLREDLGTGYTHKKESDPIIYR